MINHHLAKAVIDIAVFLEFTEENVLNADAAMEALEQLAEELQQMSSEEKDVFVQRCHELAGSYGDKEQFVRNLPEALGIGS